MEPETIAKIKEWEKKLDPEVSKRLFIRETAREAYKSGNGEIKTHTTNTIKEIIDVITVSSMTKEEIGMHIANLEKARAYLGALTQGYQIAFAEEKEPEFKAKHDREEKEKRSKQPKDLESQLSRLGIDMSQLFSKLSQLNSTTEKLGIAPIQPEPTKSPAPETVKPTTSKIKCEKCGAEVWPIMFAKHKC